MALVVECFGPPGSGKSTLAEEVAARLRAEGRTVVLANRTLAASSLVERAWSKARTVVQHRRTLAWTAKTLWRSPRPGRRKLVALRLVLATLERYRIALADDSDRIHLLDEGSIQRLFLLLVEQTGVGSDHQAAEYLRLVPVADVLVPVTASAELVRDRLERRERGLPPRLAVLAPEQVAPLLEAGEQLLRRAAGVAVTLPRRGGRPSARTLGPASSSDPQPVVDDLLAAST